MHSQRRNMLRELLSSCERLCIFFQVKEDFSLSVYPSIISSTCQQIVVDVTFILFRNTQAMLQLRTLSTTSHRLFLEVLEVQEYLLCNNRSSIDIFQLSGCGYCKRLKPDFAAAATELKGEVVSSGAIQFSIGKRPNLNKIRWKFQIKFRKRIKLNNWISSVYVESTLFERQNIHHSIIFFCTIQ